MHKTLSLMIAAAILYMVVQLQKEKEPEKIVPVEAVSLPATEVPKSTTLEISPQGNFLEKTLSKVLINVLKTEDGRLFFENILQPSNTPLAGSDQSYKINNVNFINSMFKINSFGQGTVGPASCGHIVKVHYQILSLNNTTIDDQVKTFTLGSRTVMPGLDSVIVGMKIGETRQAIIPPKYAYLNAKESALSSGLDPESYYKVNVTLQELLPYNFARDDEVKIFDDEIAYKIPLLCGDKAVFDAKIIKLSTGSIIYNSGSSGAKISMKIGDLRYPMIFSHSLYGKIPRGTRTVIAKGENFASLANKVSVIFPKEQLPSDEYFMLELSKFENIE